ncbi:MULTISPECIES: DNA primase [unclassified Streptomyces]|uniref:DNA primase n=1 Tax=unclassified Streptomyces TaxID=2593676 RepID=UPI003BB72F4E
MNRTALGLAIGAGYVLGRTKKMKLAIAVGTMVAGKRLNLSPRALADMVTTQLENNPQFKEIGDQLREDLRGVGKAASGALVERQLEGLAGRLHSRTQGVREQIEGVAPDVDDVRDAGERVTGAVPGRGRGRDRGDEEEGSGPDHDEEYAGYEDESEGGPEAEGEEAADEQSAEDRRPAEARSAKQSAAKKAPAKKRSARPQGPKKTAAKKTTAARKTAAKGGRDRG